MSLKISFIQPSRNNLRYLKWSYESLRKNLSHKEHEICVADDFSDDGTVEWCKETASKDPNFASRAWANLPVGLPPPLGDMIFQNRLWFL